MNPSNRVVWLSLLVGNAPLLIVYIFQMLVLPHYQYLPILVLVLGVMIWMEWDGQPRLPSRLGTWVGFWVGIFLSVCGACLNSPWLVALGSVLLLGCFLHANRAGKSRQTLFYLWPMSLLFLRLPINLDNRLVAYLQRITANLGSQCLDRLRVPHSISGNVFDLPSGSLFVEEACSGIQSLFTLLFCAIFLVIWNRRSGILIPLYLATAMIWAVAMNVLRIVVIAYTQHFFQWDLAHGWRHELLGYACLLIAIGLMVSSDALYYFWFSPISLSATDGINQWILLWNRLFRKGRERVHSKRQSSQENEVQVAPRFAAVIVVASIVLLVSQTVSIYSRGNPAGEHFLADKIELSPERDDLGSLTGFNLTDFYQGHDRRDSQLQALSDIWSGVIQGFPVRVALTQTYNEWHDLTYCYQGTGWVLNERQLEVGERQDESADHRWNYCTASFFKRGGEYGYLAFSGFDYQGNRVNPNDVFANGVLQHRVLDFMKVQEPKKCLMVQVWATSNVPFTKDQMKSILKAHLESREVLRKLAVPLASDTGQGDAK